MSFGPSQFSEEVVLSNFQSVSVFGILFLPINNFSALLCVPLLSLDLFIFNLCGLLSKID